MAEHHPPQQRLWSAGDVRLSGAGPASPTLVSAGHNQLERLVGFLEMNRVECGPARAAPEARRVSTHMEFEARASQDRLERLLEKWSPGTP